MSTMTLKQRVAIQHLPVLVWNGYLNESFWANFWQYLTMLATTMLIGSTVAVNLGVHFLFALQILSLTVTIVSVVSFSAYYSARMRKDRQTIQENIRRAAVKSLDHPEEEVNLSDYLHLSSGFKKKQYLNGLSNRHAKWAKKQYLKQIDAIKYERTEGLKKKEDRLNGILSTLDDSIDKTRIRSISYHLKALKDLSKQKPALTEIEQVEQELSRL